VPVFDLLARQPGIELSIWSDHYPQGSLHPAPGTGAYQQVYTPYKFLGPIHWQPMQVAAAKRAASGELDVMIFSWNSRLVHLGRALRICRRAGVPTLLWGHGYTRNESQRGAWRQRWRNRLLDLSSGCIVYNNMAADRLHRDGVSRERVFVALNALDQKPIQAARTDWVSRPSDLKRFQAERALADAELVLFISRLEPNKRVELVIDAFALVAKQRPRAKLALIGRGPLEQALREQAARLGIADRVIFAGAVYDEANLAPWFLSSACMAYPVAIGLSLLHAFGYGLPAVTSDDIESHNPEIEALRPGENGLLYRDGDLADFAEKIVECLRDPALRQRMGQAALETVREPDGFCIPRMVRGFTDAIAFAMKSAKP